MGISEGADGSARCGKADERGQDGKPESEEATATKDTDTKVGMMVCSTAREHGKLRKGGKCVMGSSKDRSTSTHSEDNIDVRGKPTEGKHGAERGRTPRCATRKGRNPACDQRDRERIRRIYDADKGRATGSVTAFGRTEREGKRERQIWRIGWSRW